MWCGSCKDKTEDTEVVDKEVKGRPSKDNPDEAKMKMGKSAKCVTCGKKKFSYVKKLEVVKE